ncbi:MAG: hypothetical protein JST42_11520 [Bacteroidetes bacterium]|nr:hypothetical protein [Bacteroidota bacterium]
MKKAATIGPNTHAFLEALFQSRTFTEQCFQASLGIMRLAKIYGPKRLEAACGRASAVVGVLAYLSPSDLYAFNSERGRDGHYGLVRATARGCRRACAFDILSGKPDEQTIGLRPIFAG